MHPYSSHVGSQSLQIVQDKPRNRSHMEWTSDWKGMFSDQKEYNNDIFTRRCCLMLRYYPYLFYFVRLNIGGPPDECKV